MAISTPSSNAPLGPLDPPRDGAGHPAERGGSDRIRPLGRRPALPGGRAVVGGLLVTLAALGTFIAYTSASTGPTATVVVAERAFAAGETIGSNDLRSVPADLPGAVQDTFFASSADLEGAVALAPVHPDQPIPRSAVSLGPGDEARTRDLSFSIERDRALSGRIAPGERIDLVATYGSGDDATTEVVARGVRVVDLDTPTGSGAGPSAKVTITVALDDEAGVLRVANALEVAKVTLIRTTGIEPAADPTEPFSAGDRVAIRDPDAGTGTGTGTGTGNGTVTGNGDTDGGAP